MGLYAAAITAAFFTSMILVILSGYRTPEQAAAAAAAGVSVADLEGPMGEASPDTLVAAAATKAAGDVGVTTEILSPLAGRVVALGDVPDPVFGKGIMGPGIAVEPSGNTAYAPGSGTVIAAQPTGHAYGILLDTGVEILIHVGLDTVKLKGEGFDVHVAKGDRVEAGTPLVTFDRNVIEAAGYPLITPIIVLNAKKFGGVEMADAGEVAVGEPIITVVPAPQPAEAGL
jgi:PTS system beta-glucosides-specific IIC component